MNLAHLAQSNIRLFGEYAFLTFNDRDYSNVEINRRANRLAHGLRALGVERGQSVVVMMPNCPQVIISYQAILKIGAVIVPALFLLGAREVKYILQNSEAPMIITSTRVLDKVRAAVADTNVRHIIIADGAADGAHALDDLISRGEDNFAMVETDSDDVAVMLYTAGTTGQPKGVMLTHFNLYSNAKLAFETAEFSADDLNRRAQDSVALLALPLAHSYGLTVMNVGFLSGARYVIMPAFDAEKAMALIQKYRVTDFAGVPTMYVQMLNHPNFAQFDLASVRAWGSGSAPLPVEIQKVFAQKINQPVSEGYGLSEYSPVVSTNRRNRPLKKGSVGLPIFGAEVRIVDAADRELPRGEAGELIVRGPSVMKGYHNLPEQTARALRNGWLHTGDIARMDEDGYLYIVERNDDLIIRGGENIYPREVEEVLYRHSAIVEAAVIGVPDAVMGQAVHAYVVLKKDQTATEEELIKYCAEQIAKFKTPKSVTFLQALPKNIIGKILRKDLRAMYKEKS
ncbi:MAG: long-chain fatty acid--CoA ligase [Chloroflexi bacterium]|nr:long-chain fatty acid--CoA ligase [Chloroflexota bacterium]